MRFPMRGDDACRVLRFGEAVNGAVRFIDPVLDEAHVVFALHREISLVRFRDVSRGHFTETEFMYVDKRGSARGTSRARATGSGRDHAGAEENKWKKGFHRFGESIFLSKGRARHRVRAASQRVKVAASKAAAHRGRFALPQTVAQALVGSGRITTVSAISVMASAGMPTRRAWSRTASGFFAW